MQSNKRLRADGRPFDPYPKGWRHCPPMGEVSDLHPFIPCKVPLGGGLDQGLEPHFRFNPTAACGLAHQKLMAFAEQKQRDTNGMWVPPWLAGRFNPALHGPFQPQLAVLIDLTNSNRYYDFRSEVPNGVAYVKVPCVGRDASPDPLAVNQVCWEINKALMSYPNTYFLIHCTHGFNRTGYMITCAMMRLLAPTGMCVERAVRRFAQQRPPGIYKKDYIDDLFSYHHEARPAATLTPPVPAWKGPDTPEGDEDDDGEGANGGAAPAKKGHWEGPMHHDDKFGELVPSEEREWLCNQVYDAMIMQDPRSYTPGAPPPSSQSRQGPQFAGSQPVSLDREKLEYIKAKRYWVTWKADGTRYMLLLTSWGAYLIDRSCDVRRVQMRFPTCLSEERQAAFNKARQKAKRPEECPLFPVGPPHNWTLLDGEMVVDEIEEKPNTNGSGGGGGGGGEDGEAEPPKKQRRRYLAYDLMLLGGEGVMDLKFGDRHMLIEKEVAAPRGIEGGWMTQLLAGRAPLVYLYTEEPFGFRRKEFWQLHRADKLLREFIPHLCHESDGLILQPHDDPYIPRTCDDLLKWKFDHLNSVDFKLDALAGREPQLLLNFGGGRSKGGADLNQHRPKEGVRLLVKPGFDPCAYHGKIIECSYNREERAWEFMRERTDKQTANYISVFEKVVNSIADDLQEGDLLETFEAAYRERPHLYDEDIRAQQGHPPQPRRAWQPTAAYQQQHRPPPAPGGYAGGGGYPGAPPPQGHWPGPPQQQHHGHAYGAPPQQQHRGQQRPPPPQQQHRQAQQQRRPPGGWQDGAAAAAPPPRQPAAADPAEGYPPGAEEPEAGDDAAAGDDVMDGDDVMEAEGDEAFDDYDDDDPAAAGPGLGRGDGDGGEEEEGEGDGGYAATEGGELAPPPAF